MGKQKGGVDAAGKQIEAFHTEKRLRLRGRRKQVQSEYARKAREGDSLLIALEGRLDTTTVPALESEGKQELPGVKEIFDLHPGNSIIHWEESM